MKRSRRILLSIDAFTNLLIGIVLLLIPSGLMDFLGLPPTGTYFYASLLGAVIFGIGLALVLELFAERLHFHGLGLHGAIVINLCGAAVLLAWLLPHDFNFPFMEG